MSLKFNLYLYLGNFPITNIFRYLFCKFLASDYILLFFSELCGIQLYSGIISIPFLFAHHWAIQPSVEMFCIQKPHTALWPLCFTGGDQIAAEAPHKHSLRIEAHNWSKSVIGFSKPTQFSMHRQLQKQLPLLGRKVSVKYQLTHHMATMHRKLCSLVWKCFVCKRRITAHSAASYALI